MNANRPSTTPVLSAAARTRQLVGRLGLIVVAFGAILFGAAGRLDWTAAWVCLLVYVSLIAIGYWLLYRIDPTLVEERARPGKGVKVWDRRLVGMTALLWPLMLLVAGLDMRNGWSGEVPAWVQVGGLIIFLLGQALATWAATTNRFYSRLVRIQADRGHTVTTTGPYRFVRHPGYVGVSAYSLATGLLLGSLWALLPALGIAITLVVRTALEDRTLRAELPGYADYARRVRYRLIPGVW